MFVFVEGEDSIHKRSLLTLCGSVDKQSAKKLSPQPRNKLQSAMSSSWMPQIRNQKNL